MYDKLQAFITKKEIKTSNQNRKDIINEDVKREKLKSFANLTATEKWGILENVLRDMGYVE